MRVGDEHKRRECGGGVLQADTTEFGKGVMNPKDYAGFQLFGSPAARFSVTALSQVVLRFMPPGLQS